jgi:hypothetical protein
MARKNSKKVVRLSKAERKERREIDEEQKMLSESAHRAEHNSDLATAAAIRRARGLPRKK